MKKVRAGPASPTSTNGIDTCQLTHVVNNFCCKANNYYDFTPSRRTPTIRLAVKRREQVGAVDESIKELSKLERNSLESLWEEYSSK